jgi:hypothetical protein
MCSKEGKKKKKARKKKKNHLFCRSSMMFSRRKASRVPDGYSEGFFWKKKTGKKNNTKESIPV